MLGYYSYYHLLASCVLAVNKFVILEHLAINTTYSVEQQAQCVLLLTLKERIALGCGYVLYSLHGVSAWQSLFVGVRNVCYSSWIGHSAVHICLVVLVTWLQSSASACLGSC